MAQAQSGDTVQVHYIGTLNDGTQFDSTYDRGPLSFKLGANEIIRGFDKAVQGMEVGEIKLVTLPPSQAYGQFDKDRVYKVPIKELPAKVVVGSRLEMSGLEDQAVMVTVLDIEDGKAKVNANNPLAGLNLKFEIELLSID